MDGEHQLGERSVPMQHDWGFTAQQQSAIKKKTELGSGK